MFDRESIKRKRGRAARRSDDPFLLHYCADEMAERLFDINRNFDNALVFGAPAFSARLIEKAGPDKIKSVLRADFSDARIGVDQLADESALPYLDDTFDLVVSGLTLHQQNEPRAALSELKRVLKPDGVLMACLFGGVTLTELRRTFYAVEEAFTAQVSPRVIPMMTLQTASALLHSMGYALPVADRETLNIRYGQLSSLVADLRRMGETNSLTQRNRTVMPRRFWKALEASYRTNFSDDGAKLNVSFEIIWLNGWKPHPDQPKPLKPGSAKARLSDVLGVVETKI